MIGLAGLELTSETGARSWFTPIVRSSDPVIAAARCASSVPRPAPSAMHPGELSGRRTDSSDDALFLVRRDHERDVRSRGQGRSLQPVGKSSDLLGVLHGVLPGE